MSKKLESRFREEVRRRTQPEKTHSGQKVKMLLLLIAAVIGCICLLHQCRSTPVNTRSNEIVTPKNEPTPIALPLTGVLKQYHYATNQALGRLRFFLRAPLTNEKSSLPTTCSSEKNSGATGNSNHYFVQVLDWQSDQVTSAAFIRSGEMVEMAIPFGIYKLRYAVGTEWYGEKQMFGTEEMYEMTEPSSAKTAKFEFSMEKSGGDIGAYCFNGNLGKKRVRKDQHE